MSCPAGPHTAHASPGPPATGAAAPARGGHRATGDLQQPRPRDTAPYGLTHTDTRDAVADSVRHRDTEPRATADTRDAARYKSDHRRESIASSRPDSRVQFVYTHGVAENVDRYVPGDLPARENLSTHSLLPNNTLVQPRSEGTSVGASAVVLWRAAGGRPASVLRTGPERARPRPVPLPARLPPYPLSPPAPPHSG